MPVHEAVSTLHWPKNDKKVYRLDKRNFRHDFFKLQPPKFYKIVQELFCKLRNFFLHSTNRSAQIGCSVV